MSSLYFVPTNNTVEVHGSHFPVSEPRDCQEWADHKEGHWSVCLCVLWAPCGFRNGTIITETQQGVWFLPWLISLKSLMLGSVQGILQTVWGGLVSTQAPW